MKKNIIEIIILLLLLISNDLSAKEKGLKQTVPAQSNNLSEKDKRKFDYFFLEALKLKYSGKFADAFNAFSHSISIDSTASAALYEISDYYLYLNKPDVAVSFLKKAVFYNDNNFDYKIALANITRDLEMIDEAVKIYEELVGKYPDKSELNYYLSELYTKQGKIDKAIEALDILEENIGMNEALSIQKYRLYNSIEQQAKALSEIEKLEAKYPMEAKYPIILGDIYLEQGEPEKALRAYERARNIEPGNPYYIVSMANYYEYIGDKAAAQKQIDTALRNNKLDVDTKLGILSRYISTLQSGNKNTEGVDALFETLMEQHPQETDLNMMYGAYLLSQNRPKDAKFQFQIVTETSPEDIMAWKQLLNISIKESDMDEIIRICDQALIQFPGAPEFYFYKGIGYYQKENYEQALQTYLTGLNFIKDEDRETKSDFYGQTGDIYHQMGQKEKAYESYEQALKYNDRNINVLNNYAYFLSLAKKDLDKAERMASQCVKMQSDNNTYIDTYAWIFFVKENYTLAKFYIESAMSKGGDKSAEIVDHYGDILYMTGEKEKAVEQWEKALLLGKDTEIIRKKITEKKYYEDTESE